MIQPGEVISYLEMCRAEDVNLQRGMNYRLRRDRSVFLMSRRLGAPYADHVEDGGRVLIYGVTIPLAKRAARIPRRSTSRCARRPGP